MPDRYLGDYAEFYEVVGRIPIEIAYDVKNYDVDGYLFQPSFSSIGIKEVANFNMMFNKEDIETDLKVGKAIFENVPNGLKPYWSGLILSAFDSYIKEIPNSVRDLHSIIADENRWSEAHAQFSKIRQFLLDYKLFTDESFLLLAEKVAKVTYNASGKPAPFDGDSGWYIPGLALQIARSFKDARLMDELQVTILLFSNNKRFKKNIQTVKEFLLYRKIDEILWFDWDPIGVNDINGARDEYESYVPEIFHLKKANAGREEIAKRLFKMETERIGLNGTFENCLAVADKIIGLQHWGVDMTKPTET